MSNQKPKPTLTLCRVKQILAGGSGSLSSTDLTHRPKGGTPMDYSKSSIFRSIARNRLAVSLIALSTAFGVVNSAYATIDNTVTVTGTPPGGAPTALDTDAESVDVLDALPGMTISKTATLVDGDADSLGDAAETISYSYTIENTGNTTLTGVGVNDTHDGVGTFTAPTFASWSNQNGSPAATLGDATVDLLPGAVVVFETTYTIVAGDISGAGGTGVGATVDGDIDNSAVAVGTYPDGTGSPPAVTSSASVAEVSLDVVESLQVAKAAYTGGLPATLGGSGTATNGTTDNLTAGTAITYVYTVTNDGNVPISTVGLTDSHNGLNTTPLSAIVFNSFDGSNTGGSINDDSIDSNPNQVDILEPGDVAYFTATYTVDQLDVDQLQ